ncbi:MAG: hypothetical protein R3300_21135, partial [Candidatus Promineifilaceae bacterium]|nr:hypothetical protein [Candidatus Promineifilaceae bacterium]
VAVEVGLPPDLTFPPSILALSPDLEPFSARAAAVVMFRAALISLIGSKQCRVIYYQRWHRIHPLAMSGPQVDVLLTLDKEGVSPEKDDGTLETKVLGILAGRHDRTRRPLFSDPAEWPSGWLPQGGPIDQLVRAVIEKKRPDPYRFVVDLVAKDAVSKDWGEWSGSSSSREMFQLFPSYTSRYNLEVQDYRDYLGQFADEYPTLDGILVKRIRQGINAMIEAEDSR